MDMHLKLHYPIPPLESVLYDYRDLIRRCFSPPTVEGIVAALKAEAHPFAQRCLASLAKGNPTALKVTHRLLTDARLLPRTLAECLQHEYRAVTRLWAPRGELREGVRAYVIERDGKPQRAAATLEQVPLRLAGGVAARGACS